MNKVIENSEVERTKLVEMIKSFEVKMNSIEQRSVEEQWSMRQRQATLDAERVAFERERSFMREKMKEEEKRIQVIASIQLMTWNGSAFMFRMSAGIEREAIRRASTTYGSYRCRAA